MKFNGNCDQCGKYLAYRYPKVEYCPNCGAKLSPDNHKEIRRVKFILSFSYLGGILFIILVTSILFVLGFPQSFFFGVGFVILMGWKPLKRTTWIAGWGENPLTVLMLQCIGTLISATLYPRATKCDPHPYAGVLKPIREAM